MNSRDLNGKGDVSLNCEVNTNSGSLRRPVSKLAVLDVQDDGEVVPMGSIHGVGDVDNAA